MRRQNNACDMTNTHLCRQEKTTQADGLRPDDRLHAKLASALVRHELWWWCWLNRQEEVQCTQGWRLQDSGCDVAGDI